MKINKLDGSTMLMVSKNDLMDAVRTVLKESSFTQNKVKSSETQVDEFINMDRVSEITGYKRPTLYRFVALKEIPHYKRRGRIWFKPSEIKKWMNEGRCKV